MYSRGRGRGRGSGGGGGNWRQDREDFSRRYQGGGSQDGNYSQNFGCYDNKRPRVTDTGEYGRRQYGNTRDEEGAGSSYRRQRERPPPHLTGKDIEHQGRFSQSWSKTDEPSRRYEGPFEDSHGGDELFTRDRGRREWDSSGNEQNRGETSRADSDRYARSSTSSRYDEENRSYSRPLGQEGGCSDRGYSEFQTRGFHASSDQLDFKLDRGMSRGHDISAKRSSSDGYENPNKFSRGENQFGGDREQWTRGRSDTTYGGDPYGEGSRPSDKGSYGGNQDRWSAPNDKGLYDGGSRQEASFKSYNPCADMGQGRGLETDRPYGGESTESGQQDTSRGLTGLEQYRRDHPYRPDDRAHRDHSNRLPFQDQERPPFFTNEYQNEEFGRPKMRCGRETPSSSYGQRGDDNTSYGNRAEVGRVVPSRCSRGAGPRMSDPRFQGSHPVNALQKREDSEFDDRKSDDCSDDEKSCSGNDDAQFQEQGQGGGVGKFKRKRRKPLRVIIEGIPMEVLNSEIKNNLRSYGFRANTVVRKTKFKVFKATLSRNDKAHKIFGVKKLVRYQCNVIRMNEFMKRVQRMKKERRKLAQVDGNAGSCLAANQAPIAPTSSLSLPHQPPSSHQRLDPNTPPQQLPKRGLWFRERNRAKQRLSKEEKSERKMKRRTCFPVELPVQKIKDIRKFLDSIGMEAPPTISQIRNSNESFSGSLHDKYSHIEDSEFKTRFLRSISGSIDDKMRISAHENHLYYKKNKDLDDKYKDELFKKRKDPEYLKMLEFRQTLPSFSKAEEILTSLERHQVILISGETGCGKTTQVPQFILDHEIESGNGSVCHVLCTQPRRISAISVAERVAQERAEKIGNSVGYQIRLEHARPRETGSIVYCTTGILLQMLQGDPVLKQVSHVVLDEIHERDTISDFSITILKDLITMRKDLKIILMSATLNADQFSKYFDSCPTVHIPGFTFPVKELYLEDVLELTGVIYNANVKRKKPQPGRKNRGAKSDYVSQFLEPYIRSMRNKKKYSEEIFEYLLSPEAEQINMDLIVQLVLYICRNKPDGAILVFLPGWDKISSLVNKMTESNLFPDSRNLIIPLHSMMTTAAQKSIFEKPPPGVRKIVVATNIAETSITIDDIVYVIDCGKIKIKNFEVEHNITTLKEEWVSIANAKQRKGRAGRVQEGVCYHLYSRPKELTLDSFQLPEMLRTRLEEVILQMKVLQLGKAIPFLNRVMDPPLEQTILLSIDLLKNMNALDSDENLTPLGYHLAHLPVDPQAGKMILFAALFGCVDPITSIAASLSFKDAFIVPVGKEKQVKEVKLELAAGTKSDLILMANVMSEWRKASDQGRSRSFTCRNFLANNTLLLLRDMKKQFVEHLYEMKFVNDRNVESEQFNLNSDNHALLRSVICAGLYPNIAIVKKRRRRPGFTLFSAAEARLFIHIKSVNFEETEMEGGFLAYYLKIKSNSVQLHDSTMIFPMSLIFFCQNFTIEDYQDNVKLIKLNNNICFTCQPQVASIIQELRAWLDWLLEYKVAHPGIIDWSRSTDETLILQAIVVLLTAESRLYLQEYSDNSDDDMYYSND